MTHEPPEIPEIDLGDPGGGKWYVIGVVLCLVIVAALVAAAIVWEG